MIKIIHILVYTTIIFYFSEGKQCPEETRPHKTRCDIYFKCVVLPSKKYVWVPVKCDLGLVYEKNLKTCVLPEDDWECTNDEFENPQVRSDDNFEIYPEPKIKLIKINPEIENDNTNISLHTNLNVDNKKFTETYLTNHIKSNENYNENFDEEFESSGDGYRENLDNELKENDNNSILSSSSTSSSSTIDLNLKSHLQRLSQLIDGLQKKYQMNKTSETELRPDQINAFLAHYNIKSEFDAVEPYNDKSQILNEHNIQPEISSHIPQKQEEFVDESLQMKTIIEEPLKKHNNKMNNVGKMGYKTKSKIKDDNQLKQLRNQQNEKYYNFYQENPISISYTEDQINEPKIPEDTLQTVLELSKQMASNQNTRHIITLNGLFQPQLHQAYYALPYSGTLYSNNYRQNNLNEKIENNDKYDKKSSEEYHSCNDMNEKLWYNQPTIQDLHFENYNNQKLIDSYGNEIIEYINYPPYNSKKSTSTETKTIPLKHNNHKIPAIQYFTPSPHLDDSNVNEIVEIDNFSTLPFVQHPNQIQIPLSKYQEESITDDEYASSPTYYEDIFHRNQLPPHLNDHLVRPIIFEVNPANVNIEPNSYKTSSKKQQQNNFLENQNTLNKQEIVNKLLTSTSLSDLDRIPHVKDSTVNNNHELVNLAGNFVDYNIFKNYILSSIKNDLVNFPNNLEIINCNSGTRQPNSTDCTKYYVCSRKDNNIFSYSCPPYTAFNAQTRICDAKTYIICNPHSITSFNNDFTIFENHKIQIDALKALQEAKIKKQEAINAHNLANLIRIEKHKKNNNVADNISKNKQQNKSSQLKLSIQQEQISTNENNKIVKQKRKYYCKEGAKIPDQLSVLNYYVCYKSKDGRMRGHKMTCSTGLMFCAKSSMCTLPRKCNFL